MRRILLTTLVAAMPAVTWAQTSTHTTTTPEHSEAVKAQAERIRAYLEATSAQTQVAPDGLKPMPLYKTPAAPVVDEKAPQNQITEAGRQTHTVAQGDTLYAISKRYNVTLIDLRQANNIADSAIRIGQTLKIPASLTVPAVTEARPIPQGTPQPVATPDKADPTVRIARRIVEPVPDESETQMAADPTAPVAQIYAVLPKDTLSAISRRTCVGVADLIAENGIENPDVLKPGQRLTLPDGHCLPK